MVKRQAAGLVLPVGCADTARDVELALEEQFMDHGLVRFAHQRETNAEDPFTFIVSHPNDAEKVMWDHTPLLELRKMGLARRLEVEQGLPRIATFNEMSKIQMVLRIDPSFVPPPPPGKGGARAKAELLHPWRERLGGSPAVGALCSGCARVWGVGSGGARLEPYS